MKDIPKWLAESLSQPKKPVDDNQPSNPESIKPDINESTIDIFLGDAVANLSDHLEVAKRVLKPDEYFDESDEYSEEPDLTVPYLKILDPDSPDTITSTGFDPCDTVKMHKK